MYVCAVLLRILADLNQLHIVISFIRVDTVYRSQFSDDALQQSELWNNTVVSHVLYTTLLCWRTYVCTYVRIYMRSGYVYVYLYTHLYEHWAVPTKLEC